MDTAMAADEPTTDRDVRPLSAQYPDLAGRVAVVTGGSRALGAVTCRYLADNGVRVAVVGRDEAALAAVVEEIVRCGGTAIGVPADCTNPAAVAALRDRVERAMSPARLAQLGEAFPLRRIGEPADVAAATAFLASDSSSWITGVTLDVAGGKIIM